MKAVNRYKVARWLERHGFSRLPRGATGHVMFERNGHKVMLSLHGSGDMSIGTVGALKRSLRKAGVAEEELIDLLG